MRKDHCDAMAGGCSRIDLPILSPCAFSSAIFFSMRELSRETLMRAVALMLMASGASLVARALG